MVGKFRYGAQPSCRRRRRRRGIRNGTRVLNLYGDDGDGKKKKIFFLKIQIEYFHHLFLLPLARGFNFKFPNVLQTKWKEIQYKKN